jgi:peptide chain release factor subunit 1
MITRDHLSNLLSFDSSPYLTTTLYLQIDASPRQTHLISLKDLIKERKRDVERHQLPAESQKSIEGDFQKIADYVNLDFARDGAKTLALFSCSAKKWFESVKLTIPFSSQLIVNSRAYVLPLSLILEEYKRFLVIVIERAKARLLEVFAGEILDHTDLLDEVPGRVRVGGFGGYEERRIERHIEDHVRRHFKRVAETAYYLKRKYQNDCVVLWGSEQNTIEFFNFLPVSMQHHITASLHEQITATPKEILDRIMKLEEGLRQKEEKKLLDRLFQEVHSGGLGVIGLDSTIRALQQGQVNSLVVQRGYAKNGFRCTECKSLLPNNGLCDYCGGKTVQVEDIVQEAAEEALLQGCQVRFVSLPDSPLVTAGSVGAILRFKT